MNNLKRVLALSLAATSILSAAASASFTDTVDLASEAAIDTLVGLGVIKGYEDGTFRPENTVTRAEMAKMIYTIRMGGNDASDLFVDVPTSLSDIEGHWAAGYIKYCESVGIIAGRGDGKFYPEATVTGTEAIKMALVVLGYDAEISELTGVNWSLNTLNLGSVNGLTTDFVGSLSAAAQRQSAATVLYNALYANMVKYSGIFDSYEQAGYTLAESAFNLGTIENATITASTTGSLQFSTTGTRPTGEPTVLNGNMDLSDYVGLTVDVLYNSNNKNVLGVRTITGSTMVVDTLNNFSYSSANTSVTVDGVEIYLDAAADSAFKAAADSNATITVVDYDGKLVTGTTAEYLNVDEVVVAKVSYVGTSTVNVANVANYTGAASVTTAGNNISTGIAKDDLVVVTANSYDSTTSLEVIESQIGTVTATKTAALPGQSTGVAQFLINGEWYTLSSVAAPTAPTLNQEIEYYAVGNVIYSYDDLTGAAANFAVVLDITSGATGYLDTHKAALLLADGTTVNVELTEDFAGAGTATTTGDIVAYSVTSAGKYFLYQHNVVASTYEKDFGHTQATPATFNSTTDLFADGSYVADDAVIFVSDANGDTVITGAQLKGWKDATYTATITTYYTAISGFNYVQFAYVNLGAASAPTVNAENFHYGYVTVAPYTIAEDGVNYEVVTIWNGSTTLTVKIDGTVTVAKGDIVTLTTNDDLYVDGTNDFNVETTTDATVDAITVDGKTLDLGGSIFNITDDTVVIYIDGATKTGTFGTIELASQETTPGSGTYDVDNVTYVANATTATDLDLIVVELSGDISLINFN